MPSSSSSSNSSSHRSINMASYNNNNNNNGNHESNRERNSSRRNNNSNNENNNHTNVVTEWLDHWSTMFPFVSSGNHNNNNHAAATTTAATTPSSAASMPTMAVFANMEEQAQEQEVVRIQDTFRKHLSSSFSSFDQYTARTSFSEEDDDDDAGGAAASAWDASRTLSFHGSQEEDGSWGELPDYHQDEELEDEEYYFANPSFPLSCQGEADENVSHNNKKKKTRSKSSTKRQRRHYRHHHPTSSSPISKWRRRYLRCDKTTKCLLLLVLVLTFIVILMGAVTRPMRRRHSGSGSGNVGNVPTPTTPAPPPQDANTTTTTNIDDDDDNNSNGQQQQPTPTLRPKPRPTATPPGYFPQLPSLAPTVVTAPVAASPAASPVAAPAPVTAPVAAAVPVPPTVPPQVSSSQPPTRPNVPGAPTVPVGPLLMGPLVGHITHDSVNLWAFHHDQAEHNLELVLYDMYDQVISVDMIPPNPQFNNVYQVTVPNLIPNTSYKYGMHIQGTRVGQGTFQTAPTAAAASQFDYILASCMNARQYRNQKVWDAMTLNNGGKRPDFSILAGDTVYLQEGVDVTVQDGVLLDRVWFRNQEQRDDPYFRNFISHVPTYAVWNDHEYGANNADQHQLGKANSWQAFRSLWANPGYGDNAGNGIYYSFYHANVHFMVTDDQWFRDPSQRNRLGTVQTEWLRQQLVGSTGVFKVIVIGSDIMQRGWETDLENIGRIVTDNRIEGVLFHSGDVHRNEYKSMSFEGAWPYPVKQITSSGVARVWRRPYAHIKVDTTLDDPTMTAHFYGAANANPDNTTWINDPNLPCPTAIGLNRDQEHTCTQTIRRSELTFPTPQ
jgi:alkaline phosphatase D